MIRKIICRLLHKRYRWVVYVQHVLPSRKLGDIVIIHRACGKCNRNWEEYR